MNTEKYMKQGGGADNCNLRRNIDGFFSGGGAMKRMFRRTAAIAMTAVAVAGGARADGLSTMYGFEGSAVGGINEDAVTWYSDENKSTEDVITPWQEGSNTCQYAIISTRKITKTLTLPDVPFYFGTDGVTVGTKVSAKGTYNIDNITLTFPNLTIFSGLFQSNADGGRTALDGRCTFKKTTQEICFQAANVQSAPKTRGWHLAGTYVADSDVTVYTDISFHSSSDGSGIGFINCTGNFSAFKGTINMKGAVPEKGDDKGYFEFRLASPTALGDTSCPRHDALVLKHRAHLVMSDNVTQDGTRGITLTLSAGQFVCLSAEADAAWTLRAPLYGSTGALKKVGAGRVTLAGSIETKDIRVEEGELVVDSAASFAADTVITVASGARLVSRRFGGIPNVTVKVDDGGIYTSVMPTDIPFDGTTVETVDCTTVTAADRAAMPKPIAVALSQAIPIPFIGTNRLELATFDAAAGFTAEDFTDATPHSFSRLPTRWLETKTADGVTTLYLIARPALKYSVDTVVTKNYSLAAAGNWTDNQAPHFGADYYQSNDVSRTYARTGGGSAIASFDFGGETLTLANGMCVYAQDFGVNELRLQGGSQVTVLHASSGGVFSPYYWPRIFRGVYAIEDSCTDANPATLSIDIRTEYADMRQTLSGTGTLRISTDVRPAEDEGLGLFPAYLTGMNGGFAGRLVLTTSASYKSAFLDLYVTNGLAFGGPLAAYSADAVRVAPRSSSSASPGAVSVTATADMTVDAANRGWYVTSGALGASNGVTFVFSPPTLTVDEKLRKTGGGTLALGCDTVGAGTDFAVEEGYVKALSAGCCTNLNLSVSEGAGIKADVAPADATVAAKGLVAKSILPAEAGGTILVAPDVPQDFASPYRFSAAVCTVPASQADLTGTLRAASVPNYICRIEKDSETYASEGLVTYRATWIHKGFTLIFR